MKIGNRKRLDSSDGKSYHFTLSWQLPTRKQLKTSPVKILFIIQNFKSTINHEVDVDRQR